MGLSKPASLPPFTGSPSTTQFFLHGGALLVYCYFYSCFPFPSSNLCCCVEFVPLPYQKYEQISLMNPES